VNPGWVSEQAFLAGYGAAQALPGPLFTFAAYLGAVAAPAPHRLVGSALGLIGIFVPGVLVLIGALPFWEELRAQVGAQASMRGVNAAVVGLLGATLYQPLWSTSVSSPLDLAVVLAAFILLVAWRTQPLVVVIVGAVAGFAFAR
jgi:chromate transporter